MIQTMPLRVDSVVAQERANRRTSGFAYLAVIFIGLVIGAAGFVPSFRVGFIVAFGLLVCGAVAILTRPILGVYLTLFFSVLGDNVTMVGYPFNANFSSRESILFIADPLTFSPVELFLFLTAVGLLVHAASARRWRLLGRPLLWPVIAFAGFAFVGLIYGVFLKAGDPNVATWEVRPLLCLIAMYLLTSRLLTRAVHYQWLAWTAVLAITVQNFFSLHYYFALSSEGRKGIESLTEHPTSLMYGWVFLLALGAFAFRNCSRWTKFLLVMAAIPSAEVFILSNRRAAVVGLAAAFVVFSTMLFFRNRRAFLVLVPTVLVLMTAYTAAFWNSTSGAAFGARAVKTVFVSSDISDRDSSSDLYRTIENYDLVNTIHSSPLTGVGFGKRFYQPAPLPDISFFVFYQFIPHNSILWIWLKVGYLGFVVFLFLVAAAIRAGTRASLTLPSGDLLVVTVCAVSFIVMFITFAYVDIAFDTRTCLFLGVCMATCANIVRLTRAAPPLGGASVPATRVQAWQ